MHIRLTFPTNIMHERLMWAYNTACFYSLMASMKNLNELECFVTVLCAV